MSLNRHDGDTAEILMMIVVWAFVLFLFVMSKDANAAEDWFCTERSVVREDTVFKSCGVAQAPLESTARLEALSDAKREFVSVCDASSDCLGHEVAVQPGRTECSKGLLGWVCRRLLVFHVLDRLRKGYQEQGSLQFHPNYYMYMKVR